MTLIKLDDLYDYLSNHRIEYSTNYFKFVNGNTGSASPTGGWAQLYTDLSRIFCWSYRAGAYDEMLQEVGGNLCNKNWVMINHYPSNKNPPMTL